MMVAKKEPEEETITMLRSDHEFAIHEAHVDGAAMERARIIAVLAEDFAPHMFTHFREALFPDL